MKISVNWIKQFTDINYSVEELVTKIGAQLGAVEEVILLGERYEGIVVGKIVSLKKHPNADKLNVCKIDDADAVKGVERDDDQLVQVVCGAPNVREGMLVAWVPPKNIVPSTWDTEQFELEAREIRGVVSNGMLASGRELALNDDHDGIMEVDVDCLPGTALADVYQLNDVIIDIENKMFTHRPDCFGMLGVARELAGIQDIQFTSPDWYKDALSLTAKNNDLPLKVVNKADDLVPRFMAQTIANVKVQPSSISVQSYLTRVGLKPVNNIVDVTNLVMLLTAQPAHAYDYDKVKKLSSGEPVLMTREAEKGDKLELLNGKTQEFSAPAVMIATDQYPVGVGGVMGGAETEVDENTTNVILECANFDMYNIRRTSMQYGLFTDAVTRFNKGQSVLQTDKVMAYAAEMIIDVSGGTLAGELHDKHGKLQAPNKVVVDPQFVSDRLGMEVTKDRIASLLKNVEFDVASKGQVLEVEAPFWRTDIEIPEDIVEEVGRLIGYDRLPLTLPKRDLTPTARNSRVQFKQRVRNILAQAGGNELLTYNFVHGDILEKSGQDPKQAYKLSNALSPDLQYFRMSLTPSLLDKVHMNQKAGFPEFALFEINKAHNKQHATDGDEKVPKEFELLAMTLAVSDKAAEAYQGAPFYAIRQYLDYLGAELGLNFTYQPITKKLDFPVAQPFDLKRSALVGVEGSKEIIGMIGEYRAEVRREFKLPAFTAGFELGIDELEAVTPELTPFTQLSRFPSTDQDITFAVENVSYADLQQAIEQSLNGQCTEHGYEYQVLPLGSFQKDEKSKQNISFRITLTHYERTLTTEEVNTLLDQLSDDVKKSVKAERA